MIGAESFLESIAALRLKLLSENESLEHIIQQACSANPWFIPEFTRGSVRAIADQFLNPDGVRDWLATYPSSPQDPRKVVIVMAGNIPLVGFHDLFCVLASGHHALIKLSEKDSVLMPWLTAQWISIWPELDNRITYIQKADQFDAAIATGSNNSARYFEYYFRSYPHLLRGHRNSVAILRGNESIEDLRLLARDIFMYFGLGCRNVSRIYVPKAYNFDLWHEAIQEWKYLADHSKYRNNLDYNHAIYIINQVPHLQLGHLILKEDDSLTSRIGCVHYSRYQHVQDVTASLEANRSEIQCVISADSVPGWEHIHFGDGQRPRLEQYADGADTMTFLTSL